MDLGLDGRTALVTGGGGRIGGEDCRILAAEGAEVVALDVNLGAAENVVEEIEADGGTAHAVECDLTDRADVEDTIAALEAETGGIDVLVNNAGMVDARDRIEEFDDEIWDRDISVNLTGAYNVTRAVYPNMKERGWGRIINMSSMAGWQGGFGQASYAATKAALIGFGKTLALEGAQHGVTSNIIAPSIVVGQLADLPIDQLETVDEHFARIAKATPMRRLGTEADVANLVAYLASEQADYITGQVVGVTGGIDLFSF
ncbi:probable oxidoreductase (short-chain dehydrogenase family) [Natronomonas pharaonis DSM 2160]|uniref:Probable oxidoreductase (Short-chain dehydrogenase family) n=1 Tax=Natronomonas pharaonis (strain ATCC 35678 / DSM 2160 / CIP 103997 / JCM 8858 / NBRC 14720 / NCIMB 2260 / Gabara) TaxID=348780 RepID=A0A1U7EVW5_NATPD|nr:SDR family NAD(P)-dependent oxidoreductase [Natronomonas pharaonis]CAI49202.1 probable oxidoreductase (short-chain dehydrogenase family) [Natronomonas pharaonis DSM 2160]